MNPSTKRVCRIVFAVGGVAKETVVHWSHVLGANMVSYVDASNETSPHCGANIEVFPVSNKALKKLLPEMAPELRDFLRYTSSNNSAEGASQVRVIGHTMIVDRIKDGDFVHFLEEMTNKLLIAENADFDSVEIIVVGSGGGGMGGGIGTLIAEALEQNAITAMSCQTVTTTIVRFGPMTHLDCGRNIDPNNLACVIEDALWLRSQNGVDEACRRVFLVETPVVGRDSIRRDHFVTATLAALFGRGCDDPIAPRLTNWAIDRQAAGIVLIRAEHRGDVRGNELVADVARQWTPKLRTLATPPPVSENVEAVDVEWAIDNEVIPTAVKRTMREVSASAKQPANYSRRKHVSPAIKMELTVAVEKRPELTLAAQIFDQLSSPARSVREFEENMDLVTGLKHGLAALKDRFHAEEVEARKQLRVTESALAKAENNLWSRTFIPWFVRLFVARPSLEATLQTALIEYLKAKVQVQARGMLIQAVDSWTKRALELKDEMVRPLSTVIQLASEGFSLAGYEGVDLVVADDNLDRFLADLADNPAERSLDGLRRSLQKAIMHLTAAGLARALNARNGAVSHLASALTSQHGWLSSPWFSKAQEPRSRGEEVIAIPKTTPALAEAISNEVARRNNGLIVQQICGACPSGVRLTARPATRLEDIFPPRLRAQRSILVAALPLWFSPSVLKKELDFENFEFGFDTDDFFKQLWPRSVQICVA